MTSYYINNMQSCVTIVGYAMISNLPETKWTDETVDSILIERSFEWIYIGWRNSTASRKQQNLPHLPLTEIAQNVQISYLCSDFNEITKTLKKLEEVLTPMKWNKTRPKFRCTLKHYIKNPKNEPKNIQNSSWFDNFWLESFSLLWKL